jgi:hypothetical protein
MKKAQTEIIGLAIVVILLILGSTFVIKFIIGTKPPEYKKDFTQSQLASNMLNTFLETTAKDCPYKMKDLLQSCGSNTNIICDKAQPNIAPCDYVKQEAETIFKNTLFDTNIHVWMTQYYLSFYPPNNQEFHLSSLSSSENPCKTDKESDMYTIPTKSGPLSVTLDICSETI